MESEHGSEHCRNGSRVLFSYGSFDSGPDIKFDIPSVRIVKIDKKLQRNHIKNSQKQFKWLGKFKNWAQISVEKKYFPIKFSCNQFRASFDCSHRTGTQSHIPSDWRLLSSWTQFLDLVQHQIHKLVPWLLLCPHNSRCLSVPLFSKGVWIQSTINPFITAMILYLTNFTHFLSIFIYLLSNFMSSP